MKFYNWWQEQVDIAVHEMGSVPNLHETEVLRNMCKHAWNHQQSIIDQQSKEIEALKQLLREILIRVENTVKIYESGAVSYLSDSERDFQHDNFGFFQDLLEKPEIKEMVKE